MVTGVVSEGVVASDKTTLLRHLQRHLADSRPACTKLVLSEHYTERVLEDKRADRTLTCNDVLSHATEVLHLIESLHALRGRSKFSESVSPNAEIALLVERWVGTHAANLAGVGTPPTPDAVSRLSALCCRLHYLTRTFH